MINEAPTVVPPQLPQFPTPRRAELGNGLGVAVLDLPGQHVVSIGAVIESPLGTDEPEGVGTICARVLDEGTTEHPGGRFNEVLENNGAIFGADQELHGITAGVDVPSSRLPQALSLFAEALIHPQLAAPDVERQVALRLAEIEQQNANPGSVAAREFRRAIYSETSRIARPLSGEAEPVARITHDTVTAYHALRYAPDLTTVIIGGDFAGTDPLSLVDSAFGGWQVRSTPTPQPDAAAGEPVYRLIPRAEAVQANLQLGGFGIDRNDPRWPAFRVALYAMGGSFGSRLNLLLREDLGYTYGVRLAANSLRSGGSFALAGSFRTEVTADAIEKALETMLDARPITAEEVDNAVNYFIGSAPLQWATAEALVDQQVRQLLGGQDDDYLRRSLAALTRVTAEQATAAYSEIVTPQSLSLVVVGDPALADSLPQPASLAPLQID